MALKRGSIDRFDGKVADYDRYRERYTPEVVLQILRERCGLTPQWRVVDVGAGTGMLSDVFLANGNRVTAVEPNAEMRAMCAALHPGALLEIVDGTAEKTGLPDGCCEIVTAGRAMHWFLLEEAMAEFRRILVPRGWVAIVAFGRTEQGLEENVAIEQVLRSFSHDHKDTHAGYAVYRRLGNYLRRDFHHEEILSSMQMDWDSLHGLIMSLSHSPSRGDEAYPAFEKALREVFERYAKDDRFTIETRYWINVGRLAD